MGVAMDMSEAFGPENTDQFEVIRREQSISDWGEPDNNDVKIPDLFGVVDAGDQNAIAIATDEQHFDKSISVVTQFKLRGTSKVAEKKFAPDLVKWNGDFYKVVLVEDYSRYGFGWIQAQCVSQNYIEKAPTSSAKKLATDC